MTLPTHNPWLERFDWLRDLARRMVRDECAADDLAQDVVLKALCAGRADAPRAWWVRVLRNAARDGVRDARLRLDHESQAAATQCAPSAHAVISEAETQNRVAEAVLALDEPYRTVLLLRYFRELPPRAIARELGRPVGTVKVQLERAREVLRARLRVEFGGSATLALALVPVAGTTKLAALVTGAAQTHLFPAAALGGILAMKLTLALPLLVIALLGAWSLGRPTEPSGPSMAGTDLPAPGLHGMGGTSADEPTIALATPGAETKSTGRTVAARPSTPTPGIAPVHASTPIAVRGVALDLESRPLAAVVLALQDGEREEVTTDATGHFEFRRAGTIDTVDPATAVFVHRDARGLRELRIARTVRFAGRVVDSRGKGLAGVWVHEVGRSGDTGVPDLMAGGWEGSFTRAERADDDGRFDMGRVFAWSGRTVLLVHPRFMDQEVLVPGDDVDDALIVFENATESQDLAVLVLDESGAPAKDAVLLVRGQIERVGDDGKAVVSVDDVSAGTELVATRPGYEPVRATIPSLDALALGANARELVLSVDRLGGVIEGQVVDREGAPLSGATIGVWNATLLGPSGTAETLELRDTGVEFLTIRSGADGRFTIRGLAPRPHTIRAVLKDPLRVAEVRDVLPGTEGLRLEMGAISGATRIEGRVVDALGEPMADVAVMAEARLVEPQGDPRFETGRAVEGPKTRTDDAGRFQFDSILPGGVRLRVDHRGAVATIAAADDDLTIVLDVPCTVILTHTTETARRAIVVLDGKGQPMRFSRVQPGMIFGPYERFELDGAVDSTHLLVSQGARVIALEQGDREVARTAVAPDRWGPMEVNL